MARSTIYPPSVKPGIPRLGEKPDGWTKTTFGDVLEPVQRPADLQDEVEYQLVNAKRSRGGIVGRGKLLGKDIKTETQFYIAEDDFLISKRQIIHGACGVVPHELDGAVVSNEYVSLIPKNDLLLDYLNYYCHSLYFQQTCFHASVGVDVEKMIFRLSEWFKYELYLPPLPEQRKIAAILSTWDEAITLTEQLIAALTRRKQALMKLLLTGAVRFPGFEGEWEEGYLGDVAQINPPKPTNVGSDVQVSFITMADVSEEAKLLGKVNRKYDVVRNGFTAFQDRDVLIAKITPCFENGKGALVEGLTNGIGFGSTEFHVARANLERTIPEYIYYHTTSHRFRGTGEANMTGSAGQKRVPTEFIRSYQIPLPSVREQQKITDMLIICDSELDIYSKMVSSFQTQKRGLMQQLLTGAVRVGV